MEERYWVKDGFLIFRDEVVFPQGGQLTYVPYGLKGIVLPLLERPADVNRLYKGINRDQPWKSPDIYYEGSYRQCLELEKRFGISELSSRDNHVNVYPWYETAGNPMPIRKEGKHFEYIRYWDYDNDRIPKFLSDKQVMDSALLLGSVSTTEIKLITGPETAVYRPLRVDGEDYVQVCLHSPWCLERLRRLCQYKGLQRMLLIEHVLGYDDDFVFEISVADGSKHPIGDFVLYASQTREDGGVFIDDSGAEKETYRNFIALGAEYHSHKEMIDYVMSRVAGNDINEQKKKEEV
ncbi:MAG: hypothetical protein IJM79_06420 [Erysipelotrichaceae bacterium]|nr:hypothetical protein [Erysipelotrichaceae bacterium]